MFTRKNIFSILLFILALLVTGCATTYAPDDWLPDTDDIPQNAYGGWITVVTQEVNSQSDEEWMQYSGEFIALDEEYAYLLYDSLYVIPKNKIVNSTIELDQKNTGGYAIWVTLGSLSTASHGKYALLTLPVWLLGGIPTASGESFRDTHEAEYPDEIYWNDVNKYSRFPQGVEDINLSELQPIFNEIE